MGNVKKILIAAAAVLLLTAGGTMAYFTYQQHLGNTFSVGENRVEITEEYEPPKESGIGDNIYKKKVQVKNTGSAPCFVRVIAEFSDSQVRDKSFLSPDGESFYSASGYAGHLPDSWAYIPLGEDGLLGGYYYFTEPVAPGRSTTALFEAVNSHFDTQEEIKDYEIIIYAESVQTRDRFGAEFTGAGAYRQAWTEFLERR